VRTQVGALKPYTAAEFLSRVNKILSRSNFHTLFVVIVYMKNLYTVESEQHTEIALKLLDSVLKWLTWMIKILRSLGLYMQNYIVKIS